MNSCHALSPFLTGNMLHNFVPQLSRFLATRCDTLKSLPRIEATNGWNGVLCGSYATFCCNALNLPLCLHYKITLKTIFVSFRTSSKLSIFDTLCRVELCSWSYVFTSRDIHDFVHSSRKSAVGDQGTCWTEAGEKRKNWLGRKMKKCVINHKRFRQRMIRVTQLKEAGKEECV